MLLRDGEGGCVQLVVGEKDLVVVVIVVGVRALLVGVVGGPERWGVVW